MSRLDLILLLLTPGLFLAMHAAERRWPARDYPPIRRWELMGALFFAAALGLGVATPMLLPMGWIAEHALLHGERLGVAGGVAAGFVATSLGTALVHRLMHTDFLWKRFHQMHHSPQRMDLCLSAFAHPAEFLIFNAAGLLVGVLLLGLDPVAGSWLGFLGTAVNFFEHWNLRTPRWVGWLVQRPEGHAVHHQRGIHHYNFSDFPLWDLIMGTFRNPDRHAEAVGFEPSPLPPLGRMLLAREVPVDGRET